MFICRFSFRIFARLPYIKQSDSVSRIIAFHSKFGSQHAQTAVVLSRGCMESAVELFLDLKLETVSRRTVAQ